MDLSEPLQSVVPGTQGGVLAVLARAAQPLTGRAIAGFVKDKRSTSGVHYALTRLVAAGLVTRTTVGAAALYELNREHVAANGVIALARQRDEVLERFRTAIAGWAHQPVSATVFGSFARGEGGPESDIDLLLVHRDAVSIKAWNQQVADLTVGGRRWTGNPVNVVGLSSSALLARVLASDALVANAAEDGLTVGGETLARVLARLRRRK